MVSPGWAPRELVYSWNSSLGFGALFRNSMEHVSTFSIETKCFSTMESVGPREIAMSSIFTEMGNHFGSQEQQNIPNIAENARQFKGNRINLPRDCKRRGRKKRRLRANRRNMI